MKRPQIDGDRDSVIFSLAIENLKASNDETLVVEEQLGELLD